MGMSKVSMRSAWEDAAGPESAAHEVAASAPCANKIDWEFSASAVLAEVRITMSPSALAVATAVLFDAPDEELEVDPVPSRAAAAADAASPDE